MQSCQSKSMTVNIIPMFLTSYFDIEQMVMQPQYCRGKSSSRQSVRILRWEPTTTALEVPVGREK